MGRGVLFVALHLFRQVCDLGRKRTGSMQGLKGWKVVADRLDVFQSAFRSRQDDGREWAVCRWRRRSQRMRRAHPQDAIGVGICNVEIVVKTDDNPAWRVKFGFQRGTGLAAAPHPTDQGSRVAVAVGRQPQNAVVVGVGYVEMAEYVHGKTVGKVQLSRPAAEYRLNGAIRKTQRMAWLAVSATKHSPEASIAIA
jgi:hypothetical protein